MGHIPSLSAMFFRGMRDGVSVTRVRGGRTHPYVPFRLMIHRGGSSGVPWGWEVHAPSVGRDVLWRRGPSDVHGMLNYRYLFNLGLAMNLSVDS